MLALGVDIVAGSRVWINTGWLSLVGSYHGTTGRSFGVRCGYF